MFIYSLLSSFGAGCASFLSPCILPVMPLYAAYLLGVDRCETVASDVVRKNIFGVVVFCLGMSITFMILGMTASAAGEYLRGHENIIRKGFGILFVIFGVHFIGLYRLQWLDRQLKWGGPRNLSHPLLAFVFGAAFAFGWTPCTGPILTSILALAATHSKLYEGALFLFVYSLGFSLPLIFIALFMKQAKPAISWLLRHTHKIELVSGVAMLELGRYFIDIW